MSIRNKVVLLAIIAAIPAVVVLAFVGRIPQDCGYHDFADRRVVLGIPNFFDVVSNVGLVAVGLLGVWRLARGAGEFHDRRERWPWLVIFGGLTLTGIGSGYYHWSPSTATLVWDRLPMTLVTTPLFAALVAERISVRAGLALLGLLVAAGMGSVGYWAWTETLGRGDLRAYALAQYLPLLLVPFVLGLFEARYTRAASYLVAVGWYALAKLGEEFDAPVLAAGGWVSGHTLKHLCAAVALWVVLRMLLRRRLVARG